MQNQKLLFQHFKNGVFNGYSKNDRIQGQAICLYDNGAVLIGQYHGAQPNGKTFIMIGPQTYFMGNLRKGMINGPFVIRSPQYHIYSQSSMNNVEGQIIVMDRKNKRARIWQITQGKGTCIRERECGQTLVQQTILEAISPQTQKFPSLLQYFTDEVFTRFVQKRSKYSNKLQIMLHSKNVKKISVQFQQERISAVGVIQDGQLAGIGYLYDSNKGIEIQGEIYNGVLDGQGVKRQLMTGKSIFGIFSKGIIRSLQVMDLKGESIQAYLVKIKKKIHLHSFQFSNDYLNERPIYLVRNFYQSIIENEVSYSRFLRSQKGSKQNIPERFSRTNLKPFMMNQKEYFVNNINEFDSVQSAFKSRK